MTPRSQKLLLVAATVIVGLILSDSAHAFRCGTKLVRDGMHEQQVIAVCGQPTTARQIGRTVRAFDYRLYRPRGSDTLYRHPGFGTLATDVIVTEYVYNFGPRKLMRRLIFEGGVLVTIESIGYGYIEK